MSSILDFHENVLGRRCMLVTQGNCKRGGISKFQSERKADGSFERRHLIVFDNGDSMWIDLALQIAEESLWLDTPSDAYPVEKIMRVDGHKRTYHDVELTGESIPETCQQMNETLKRPRQSSSKQKSNHVPRPSSSFEKQNTARRKFSKRSHPGAELDPSTPSMPRQRQHAVVVSPEGPMHERAASDTGHFSKSLRRSYENNKSGSNNEWLERFEYWLLNIPHGRTSKVCSHDNAKNVMKQVTKLVSGEGVGYRHWPPHIKFYEGIEVNLGYDFEKMHCEAQAYESRFGKDKVRFYRRSIIRAKLKLITNCPSFSQ